MSDESEFTFLKILLAELEFEVELSERIHDVVSKKNPKVQLAFWMKAMGCPQEKIAYLLSVSQSTVSRYLRRDCEDIKNILKKSCKSA